MDTTRLAELQAATIARKGIAQGPACGAAGCTVTTGLGQWRRRLTDAEYQQECAVLQQRWDDAYALRDIQLPAPAQPPMPAPSDFTRTVFGCTAHAIGVNGATRIHQATCSGPDSPALPKCNCTPEALPVAAAEHKTAAGPAHWAAGTAGSG